MKEFICMVESPESTQKKIRQWMSTGYQIEFISQSSCCIDELGNIVVTTSLFRIKD